MANGPSGRNPSDGDVAPPPSHNPFAPPGVYNPPAGGGGQGAQAPGAQQALVLGILSLFCCGFLLGPMAIMKANKVKQAIAMDPSLSGGATATAAMVLGVVSIVLNVVGIVVRLALMH